MTNTYDMVVSVISKPVESRQDFEIQTLVPWFRKKSEKLFRELKTEYLKDIIRNCQIVHIKRDDIIIKQGERGDCFYIILSGQVSIYILDKDKEGEEDTPTEPEQIYKKDGKLDRNKLGCPVTQLGPGAPFGEVALESEDCIRTASITADENTDLLVVDRHLYNRSVRDVLAKEFEAKKRFIEQNPMFSSWAPKYRKQLTMALYLENYSYDAVLVRQGDHVKNIYFITSGQIEVQMDPCVHPFQYCKVFKAANTTEAEKLVRRERNRPPMETQQCNIKKRDSFRSTKLCYLGINECVGDAEVLLDLNTYMQTAVCKEKTSVLVLETKHYVRLFVRRYQRTIDTMQKQLGIKLEARISLLPHKQDIPLLGYLVDIIETKNRPQVVLEKDKNKDMVTVSEAEKEFFNHKGPLIDMYGPGSVFYVIRVRERTKLKLRNKKERAMERPPPGSAANMLMGPRISPPSREADGYWRPVTPKSFRSIANAERDPEDEGYDQELADGSEYTDPSPMGYVIDPEAQNAALTDLEDRINSWLKQDNPKGGPRVERLRRYVIQDIDNPPHPGNRIIVRRRQESDSADKERSPRELEKARLAHLKILLSR
ncbi:uncharacterized protein LOC121382607 [Gigantopelta aegis]|uniref:uncharacterized protein LOC121382607 n=1 Tax=Gigantopelta aegis TaxID=1735272 RepID=UPI001B889231|nr:uncharacterized protein LOC121382607 [Gigantopelta aegis]